MATVIGREFDLQVLKAMAVPSILEGIDEAVAAPLILAVTDRVGHTPLRMR